MCNKWWLQPLIFVATIVEEEMELAAIFVEEDMELAATIVDISVREATMNAYK